VCAIDQTPFDENYLPEKTEEEPTVTPAIKRKIPISLSIVSYFFFIPGAMGLMGFFLIAAAFIFFGSPPDRDKIAILYGFGGGAFGIFYVCLSRGLRRCSRGWRTCALVLIWWGFIGLAFSIGRSFLTYVQTYDHDHKTVDAFTIRFWISCGLYFIFQVWQYRVLTRPDIRELFYNES
jgi:hypothetical protein